MHVQDVRRVEESYLTNADRDTAKTMPQMLSKDIEARAWVRPAPSIKIIIIIIIILSSHHGGLTGPGTLLWTSQLNEILYIKTDHSLSRP